MAKVETVIFDAGGVLHESNTAVTADLMGELGLDRVTLHKLWVELIPRLESGKISEVEFWTLATKKYNVRSVGVNENLLGRAFAENLIPTEGMSGIVRDLNERGLTTAVLSNTIEPHARAVREAGIYEGFTGPILVSYEIRMLKPDVKIFEYALKLLRAMPETTLFVDDSVENVAAAKSVGMQGVVFESQRQLKAYLEKMID